MINTPINLSGRLALVGPPQGAQDVHAVCGAQGWDYEHFEVPRDLMRRLRGALAIDLVVITPGSTLREYTELCRRIKFDARTAHYSVVFAVGSEHRDCLVDLFESGADDCIQLPVLPRELALRLLNAARIKRATDSLEDATTMITALANAVEGKDAYTRGHVERVATYAVEIAKRIDLDAEQLATVKTGAMVHDIGKVAVPDQVLNKPGRLTEEEFDIMKRHPIVGHDILRPLRTLRHVLPIVRWHHERPNGTGYPDGIGGDDLPLLPRIMAVADCFDAISTDRPYRKALPLTKCREILAQAADKGELDADLVRVLNEIVGTDESALAVFVPAPPEETDELAMVTART